MMLTSLLAGLFAVLLARLLACWAFGRWETCRGVADANALKGNKCAMSGDKCLHPPLENTYFVYVFPGCAESRASPS